MIYRVLALLAAIAALLGALWWYGSSKYDEGYQEARNEYNRAALKAQEQAIAKQQELINAADKTRKAKDAQIASINARHAAELGRLRDRPERRTELSGAPRDCSGATGAELSRRDGEFLAGLAARADKLRAALSQCYSDYEAIRKR